MDTCGIYILSAELALITLLLWIYNQVDSPQARVLDLYVISVGCLPATIHQKSFSFSVSDLFHNKERYGCAVYRRTRSFKKLDIVATRRQLATATHVLVEINFWLVLTLEAASARAT